MSIRNLGLGSELQSPETTSVFLLSHLVGEAKEKARKDVDRVIGKIEGIYGDWIVKNSVKNVGYLPRNTDLLYRQPSYKGESSEYAYRVGSFELISGRDIGGALYNDFISHRLGLELGQIEGEPSINYKIGLRLEIKNGSNISLGDLGEAITDFIAGFINTLKLNVQELETLENDYGDFKDILAKLPEDFDKTEKDKLLFSISQSIELNTIYFTDLTPIHPDFLHELLRYLDQRFGNTN